MEAYIADIMEFPIHYNVKERISDKRFRPRYLHNRPCGDPATYVVLIQKRTLHLTIINKL